LRAIACRGDSLLRIFYQFEVVFENLAMQWENWTPGLYATIEFEEFCLSHHELIPLLTSQAKMTNTTDISTWVELNDTVYIDL
jgi:hypothetical protein